MVQNLGIFAGRGHTAPKLWQREQGIPCATSCSHSQLAQRGNGLLAESCRQAFHLVDLHIKSDGMKFEQLYIMRTRAYNMGLPAWTLFLIAST